MLKLNLSLQAVDESPGSVLVKDDVEFAARLEYNTKLSDYNYMIAELEYFLSGDARSYKFRYKLDKKLDDLYDELKKQAKKIRKDASDRDEFFEDCEAFVEEEVTKYRRTKSWRGSGIFTQWDLYEELQEKVIQIKRGCFLPSVTGVLLSKDIERLGVRTLDIECVEDGLLTVFWDSRYLVVQNDRKSVFEFESHCAWSIVSVDFKSNASHDTLTVKTVKKEAIEALEEAEKNNEDIPDIFLKYNVKVYALPIRRPFKDPTKQVKTKGETKEVFDSLYKRNLRGYSDIVAMAKELVKVHKVDMKSGNASFVSTNKEVKLVLNGKTESDKKVSLVLYRLTFDDYKHLKFKVGMVTMSDDTRTLEVPLHWVDSQKNKFVTLVYINVLTQKEITNFTIQEKLEKCH